MAHGIFHPLILSAKTLAEARVLAAEGVEFCLESTDFTIEEQFDSSIQVEQ
jgi:hypothetical protein